MNLSIALAVYNEEKKIENCLRAVGDWAGEIVVVDGGSTDRTINIVEKYTDKIIITDNPPIFHVNKQKALDSCTGEWILQLDADEIVTSQLKIEIDKIINSSNPLNGYYLPRKNYFLGHWLKKGGLYPDFVIRLVKKGKAHFPCRSVHEQIKVEGEMGYLKNDLLHYTNTTLKDYWQNSILRYAKLTAVEIQNRNLFILTLDSFIIKPLYWLYIRLIKNKGLYDGIFGIIFALGSAMHYPIAFLFYLKLKFKVTNS